MELLEFIFFSLQYSLMNAQAYGVTVLHYGKKQIKKHPSAIAYVNMGLANEKADIEEAYKDFKKASEIDSSYALAWNNMGAVHLFKKEYDDAIQNLNRAISLNPNYLYSYGARGKAKFDTGDFQGAIEDYDQFIVRFQENAGIYLMRGKAKNNLKDYKSAIEDFTKAIEVEMKGESQNLHLYYNQRAITKGQDGQYDSAIEDYKKAVGIVPGYAQAYYNLGNLECYLGEKTKDATRKAEGCAHLKRASELGNRQALIDIDKFCK